MEDNPHQAVLVEKVKDSTFRFFTNGMSSREICALALECDTRHVTIETGRRSVAQYPATLVATAPCKDIILKGDEVDLTILPLFLHHTYDGHAYINDGRIITRDPETGDLNDGIQRLMFRSKNTASIDMRAPNHGGAINGESHHVLKKDMPIAVLLGGPTLDQLASMMRIPGLRIGAWDKLGGFLGGPAEVVKCETVDLTVPANAEIVLEGRVISSEGFIHDEGPYGEYTGTYGAEWLAHNWNLQIDCITYRNNATYQHASIAGARPGQTDMYIWSPACEGELFQMLQRAGIQVHEVYMPPASGPAVAYASITPVSGGDSKQTVAAILSASRQQLPKIAYVFDEDIDLYDDEQVKWAQAWRYNPGLDTVLIPGQNMNILDPSLTMSKPPISVTKVGFDCTIPLGVNAETYARAVIQPPLDITAGVQLLTEDQIAAEMREIIKRAPASWLDLLKHFSGQPYPLVYRAFGQLRPTLGPCCGRFTVVSLHVLDDRRLRLQIEDRHLMSALPTLGMGSLLMPSHPPERTIGEGQRWDLEELERLDRLGFGEAWIGEHFTAPWEPCPAPDLLIAQALLRTTRIKLGPLGHLLPYHNPVELAHRVAYLDHLAAGRYQLGVGVSALPSDHELFGIEAGSRANRLMTFEALELMTRLWNGGPQRFDGDF